MAPTRREMVASGRSFAASPTHTHLPKVGSTGTLDIESAAEQTSSLKRRKSMAIEVVDTKKEERWRHRTTAIAIITLLLYYAIGVLFYTSIVESWSFTDAVYFITVTTTTIGFGFISPSNYGSRMFTMCFCFLGMCLAALCFVQLASVFLDAQEKLKQTRKAQAVHVASEEMRRASTIVVQSKKEQKKKKKKGHGHHNHHLPRLHSRNEVRLCIYPNHETDPC